MDPVIEGIRRDLLECADPKARESFQHFFKEEIQCYGVKVPVVNRIAQKYWKDISGWEKREIFLLCEKLFESAFTEEAFIVSNWIPRMKDRLEPADFSVFARWIGTYISNWATCDSFCNHTMGDFIDTFPEFTGELKHWTQSENRWMRRAAAVSLIVPAKHGRFLKISLEIADLLLLDGDPMVQKGYGWLLKEASRQHQKPVFDFVVNRRAVMPRTALRYAIELMPRDMRSEAMRKGIE